jgi:hypothetical protein
MNRFTELHTALRDLPDTGPKGFEGFISAVLEGFVPELSIRFLAKAGYQRGVDASSGGQGSTWAGLECKHYELGRSAPVRDLAGGLTLAINGSDDQLDVWLLVTTGAVGALDAAELKQAADREAVGLVIIDWQLASLPILGVLCAAEPAIAMRELNSRLPNLRVEAVQVDLEAIKRDPAFSTLQDDLCRSLSAAEIGFDQARSAANNWIAERIASLTEARATLGQPLCPLDKNFAEWIDRPAVIAEMDMWYREWPSSHSVGVLVGREGVGKSWVALKWWSFLTQQPLTLLLTSNTTTAGTDAFDLMADQLTRQTGKGERRMWRRRLERWFRSPDRSRPEILLIFDGLNERPRHDWAAVLAAFQSRSTVSHVAIFATCWTSYWFSRVGPRLPADLSRLIEVPVFSDNELRNALHLAGQAFDAVQTRIREFLRVPRVFRIAVGYLAELQSGTLTVERLLVNDWRHRQRTEYSIAHTEEEFRGIVVGLAREIRSGGPTFAIRSLRAHSTLAQASPDRDLDRDFSEIMEGDLFETDPSRDGEFRVKPEHTGLVLGMLLADEIRQAKDDAATDLDAKVERAVEVVSGFSEASDIMRGAVAAGCNWRNYPHTALQALLRGWLRLRNRPEGHLNDFGAYLADRTEAYLGIADEIWSNPARYTDGQEWIVSAILANLGRDRVLQSIREYANKWLSYWHEAWHPFFGRTDQEWSAAHVSQVRAALDNVPIAERELVLKRLIVSAEESYPSTAELALVVASQGPRVPFVTGLAGWAISRAVMRLAIDFETVAWCLRLNGVDSAETERSIIEAANQLVETMGGIGRSAAVLILQALGSSACADRLSELGEPPFSRQVGQRGFPVLPPKVRPPETGRFLERLAGIEPSAIWSQMAVTVIDQDYEHLEAAVAGFAPHEAAAFVRRVLRTASERNPVSLRHLSWNAPVHSLLVRPEEIKSFDDALSGLSPELSGRQSSDACFTESQLMLALFPALGPEQRFERIINRPEPAYLLRSLEPTLGGLAPDRCNEHLISATNEGGLGRLRAALWFLSCQDFELSDAGREALLSCFDHQDQLVRTCAFRLAGRSGDPRIFALIRQGTWACAEGANGSLEGLYGSEAICLAAEQGDYAALRARITPELWGFLAERDGSDVAIDAFGDDLDLLLRALLAKKVTDPARDPAIRLNLDRAGGMAPEQIRIDPSLGENHQSLNRVSSSRNSTPATVEQLQELLNPSVFERRAQEHAQEAVTTVEGLYERARRAGAAMFGRYFQAHALPRLIRRRPQLVDTWLTLLEDEGAEEVVWHAGDFYRALALGLAAIDPDKAAGIIRRLHRSRRSTRVLVAPLNVDTLTYAAWEIPDCPVAAELRVDTLEGALSDKSLLEVALVAQHAGAEGNLISAVECDAASNMLVREARALTLVGWLDQGPTLDRLQPLLDGRRGYLGEVAQTARERLHRNRVARAWFNEFLCRREEETAWAALRMVLRCADRRFYLWSSRATAAVPDVPDRWRLSLGVASSDISNAVERNERGLEDLLFGTRIGSSKILAPWSRVS